MVEPLSERIITPMTKSLVAAVDDYRYASRIASRAEAIRRLIELGLKASAQERSTEEVSRHDAGKEASE